MEPCPNVFWINVRRRALFIRPTDVANITGVSDETASRWMKTDSTPKLEKAALIAKAIGCTVDDLLVQPEGATA